MIGKRAKVGKEYLKSFETYTRYSWVADESKKKGVVKNYLVWGGNRIFNFITGGNINKSFKNPALQ